ncbi:sialidase family protein [Tahibacter amnicola]|uniref:Glycoside hydrolase n=1 Tax=Tahibacter amnicola TaxID=2976241 RepID=A0ABY6BF86_9GAMM|nr:sialidase family protein [Tahibacter amnicola]UXI68534.1 glycoside hydrolase [Tahibacter amnicola]
MIPLFRPIGAALCALASLTAVAHEHAKPAVRPALGASVAIAPDGRVWWVGASGEHVVVRRAAAVGAPFDAPRTVNAEPETIAADGENRPKIALGKDGAIYLSWTHPRGQPYSGDIRFSRSLDQGETFSPPATVHRDRQEITHRFDALAVDGQGRVAVAWIDKRDRSAAAGRGETYAGAAIYAAWSRDGGEHFEPEVRVADHSCECCRIAAATAPDGTVWLLWRQLFDGGVRDHAWARLDAASKTPPVVLRATAENWRLDGCPHHGPSLAFDGEGRAHAVWFSAAKGSRVHYGSAPAGETFPSIEMAAAGASHADLAVDGDRVWIIWQQIVEDADTLQVRTSTDGGATFSPPREIARTTGPHSQPQVLVWKRKAYAAWTLPEGPQIVALETRR